MRVFDIIFSLFNSNDNDLFTQNYIRIKRVKHLTGTTHTRSHSLSFCFDLNSLINLFVLFACLLLIIIPSKQVYQTDNNRR